MEDQKKTFASLRDEASTPLVKLYYEVLNRFHPHDYDAAINAMSDDLREIIEACNAGFYYLEQTKTITMQHVTAQTAAALRDAGFPQPEPAPGQVWYNHFGEFWITGSDPNNILPLFSISAGVTWGLSAKTIQTTLIFAPTATDILRELREDYSLCYHAPHWRCELIYVFEPVDYWRDENPAEACAKAWLEKNKPVSS